MGTRTGKIVRITRSTGRGSDYYGLCEICGKHMSEVFASRLANEWLRNDGTVCYDHSRPALYAHKKCISELKD